jgi:hypothetical protein
MVTVTNYATDSYSNLAGLAAVAYNSPDYFREVKNQIVQQSPTKDFDQNLPSSLLSGLFGQGNEIRDIIKTSLEDLQDEPSDFKDWIDVNKDRLGGEEWSQKLSNLIEVEFFNNLDNNQSYNTSLEDHLTSSLDVFGVSLPPDLIPLLTQKISSNMRSYPSVGNEVDSIISIANNNPYTKIDKVPPDTLLTLSNSVDLGYAPNGASIVSGFLALSDYFNNTPYPGAREGVNNLPSGLSDSLRNGYINYPPYSMEALFNPDSSETVNLGMNATLSSALNELKDRDQSLLSEVDKDVYNLSLITLDLAGYTTYDPSANINGAYIDIPKSSVIEKGTAFK